MSWDAWLFLANPSWLHGICGRHYIHLYLSSRAAGGKHRAMSSGVTWQGGASGN